MICLRLACVVLTIFGILMHSKRGTTDERLIALLPTANNANIDNKDKAYLDDIIRSSVMEALMTGDRLLPDDDVSQAVEKVSEDYSKCNETCAADIGKTLGVDVVVSGEFLQLSNEYRAAFKLIDVKTATMLTMKRAAGKNIAEMETDIPPTIAALFEIIDKGKSHSISTPSDDLTGFAEITVTASAVKSADATRSPFAVEADVYFNGTRVGKTPYTDGLPSGEYVVETRYQNATPYRKRVRITAGERYTVETRLNLPLTAEELAAERKTWQRETFETWRKKHDAWGRQYRPLKARWRKMMISSGVTSLSGLALLAAGSVLTVQAKRADSRAEKYHDAWENAIDPEEIDHYAALVEETEKSRNAKHASGITLLSIGGAAVISGIVLIFAAPKLPEEPRKPGNLLKFELSELHVRPMVGLNTAGVALNW